MKASLTSSALSQSALIAVFSLFLAAFLFLFAYPISLFLPIVLVLGALASMSYVVWQRLQTFGESAPEAETTRSSRKAVHRQTVVETAEHPLLTPALSVSLVGHSVTEAHCQARPAPSSERRVDRMLPELMHMRQTPDSPMNAEVGINTRESQQRVHGKSAWSAAHMVTAHRQTRMRNQWIHHTHGHYRKSHQAS